MRDRYTAIAGLLLAAVVVVALLNELGGTDSGALGLDESPPRWPLPEFAVPAARGERLEGDANIAQDDCETSQVPCPPDARRVPACRVAEREAIRVCDFFDRPFVLSFWFSKGGDDCVDQQDVLDSLYRRYRDRVHFLSLNVRDDRDEVRNLVRERGWQMPVGYDRDGAVARLYGVAGCPTFAYAYPGGTLYRASFGLLGRGELLARIDALLGASRRAGEA
ncbi:MAG TPA: TlpA disulfide reductase family protein [Solirubrobacterales bacterium]|nr:TlpA disulfide reductase family protein [Solirubrobacterales bacterium]